MLQVKYLHMIKCLEKVHISDINVAG